MLVLSRKEGESLIITTPNNEVITVTLTRYKGQATQVGIDAPDDYVIVREELTTVSDTQTDVGIEAPDDYVIVREEASEGL